MRWQAVSRSERTQSRHGRPSSEWCERPSGSRPSVAGLRLGPDLVLGSLSSLPFPAPSFRSVSSNQFSNTTARSAIKSAPFRPSSRPPPLPTDPPASILSATRSATLYSPSGSSYTVLLLFPAQTEYPQRSRRHFDAVADPKSIHPCRPPTPPPTPSYSTYDHAVDQSRPRSFSPVPTGSLPLRQPLAQYFRTPATQPARTRTPRTARQAQVLPSYCPVALDVAREWSQSTAFFRTAPCSQQVPPPIWRICLLRALEWSLSHYWHRHRPSPHLPLRGLWPPSVEHEKVRRGCLFRSQEPQTGNRCLS